MRRLRSVIVALAASTLFAISAAPAAAAEQASLPDIEDEVMCPICGTILEASNSPQAEREREFIRAQIAQGKSKEQVQDALVAEYGPDVLAVPDSNGFDLFAWIVPIVGLLIAAGLLGLGLWKIQGKSTEPTGPISRTDDAVNARIDRDIADSDL